MKDEEYVFREEVREKGVTARGAHHRRTHGGKGGRVRFPSDYMTEKEKRAMNGEVKTYRMNDPLSWKEFKEMPDDIKVTYIKLLRQQYNVPGKYIAEMMGVNEASYSKEIKRLGIKEHRYAKAVWDNKGFYAWRTGALVADAVCEDSQRPEEEREAHGDGWSAKIIDPRDDSFEVPEVKVVPVPNVATLPMPVSGRMTFIGTAEGVLKSVGVLLGKKEAHITITWGDEE